MHLVTGPCEKCGYDRCRCSWNGLPGSADAPACTVCGGPITDWGYGNWHHVPLEGDKYLKGHDHAVVPSTVRGRIDDHLPEDYEPEWCSTGGTDEHAPECSCVMHEFGMCICDALADCRDRVLTEAWQAVAQMAVALVLVQPSPFLNQQGMQTCEDPDKYPHGIPQVSALAAIDGLRTVK